MNAPGAGRSFTWLFAADAAWRRRPAARAPLPLTGFMGGLWAD